GKILIVEDDHVMMNGLVKIARSVDDKIEVFATDHANKALDYIEDGSFDAFFLDIELLDYSGLLLAERIRSFVGYQLAPIICITVLPTYERNAFRTIHCYDYIGKPFDEERVKKVFETIIRQGVKKDHEEHSMKIKMKNYNYVISQKDIIYIES